jgi:hypothetical protein
MDTVSVWRNVMGKRNPTTLCSGFEESVTTMVLRRSCFLWYSDGAEIGFRGWEKRNNLMASQSYDFRISEFIEYVPVVQRSQGIVGLVLLLLELSGKRMRMCSLFFSTNFCWYNVLTAAENCSELFSLQIPINLWGGMLWERSNICAGIFPGNHNGGPDGGNVERAQGRKVLVQTAGPGTRIGMFVFESGNNNQRIRGC